MIDYRAVLLNRYRKLLLEKTEFYIENFIFLYNKIDNPVVYTAFLLFSIYDDGNMHFRDTICKSIENVDQLRTGITGRELSDLRYLHEIARYIKDSVGELGIINVNIR